MTASRVIGIIQLGSHALVPAGKPDFSGIYGWGHLFGGGRGGAAPALKPGAEKYRVTRGPLDTGVLRGSGSMRLDRRTSGHVEGAFDSK